MKRILFVCSGNTCRSPMAEYLLKQLIQNKNIDHSGIPFEIQSAGIFADTGLPASSEAIEVMAELGMDLSSHRSQILTQNHLEWADLVLTMTNNHRLHILSQYAICPDKVYTLAEFIGAERIDVVDPYGLGMKAYRQSVKQLQLLIEQVLKRIL